MTTNSLADESTRGVPHSSTALRRWLAVLVLEANLLVGYFVVTSARPTGELRYLIYPFVWINVGIWAVTRADPPPTNRRHAVLAGTVAGAYFLAVMAIPGNVGAGIPGAAIDLRVAMHAPGWGPIVAFTSPWVRLYLVPFEVIGYVALSYLVYVTLLTVTRGVLPGVFGLATCVGCTVPLLAPIVGLLGGSAASLSTTAYTWSYDLGTVLFVATIGLLVWSHRRDRE